MEGKFIYVFSVDDRDKMIELGYPLIQSDTMRSMYVFENAGTLKFSEMTAQYVVSDILTF